MRRARTLLSPLLLLLLAAAPAAAYDPLATAGTVEVRTVDLEVKDAARDRAIPLRAYLPPGGGTAPVLLFSHGLGGSREGSPYLGSHWAARGYVALFLQHPGSDEAVWKGKRPFAAWRALKGQASTDNFLLRVKDVPAVIDRLAAWNAEPGHPLAGRLDLGKIGMAGHSFGAVTAQAIGGQAFLGRGPMGADPRVKACVIMSPSPARRGSVEEAFGSVKIPWMLMTGTADQAEIADVTVADRLKVFPALPATGAMYELVLDGAAHFAFTERASWRHEARNPNHHRAILALSTAFWDAHLKGDAAARAWLDGDGARTILEPKDRFQKK